MIEPEGVSAADLDGFGQVPGMLGRRWLDLEVTGLERPLHERVAPVVAPAEAWVDVPEVASVVVSIAREVP